MEEDRPKATKDSWSNLYPFPDTSTRIRLNYSFTEEEFEKISYGLVPKCMDDHWFAFLDDDTLYLHRSWTGHAIYKARFVKVGNLHILRDVCINKSGLRPIYRFFPKWMYARLLLFLILDSILEQDNPLSSLTFFNNSYRALFVRKNR
ncbi:MAG: hypothetical protein R2681_12470 [Pyrinomonadaceae bacterium]